VSAKIVVFWNQKGGCNKTTLTIMLGFALMRAGFRVLLVDADPQASLSDWAGSVREGISFPMPVLNLTAAGAKLGALLLEQQGNFDAIIVDCPAALASEQGRFACRVADLLIIPCPPRPLDMKATVKMKPLVASVTKDNPQLVSRLMATMCRPQTKLTKELMVVLRDFGIPLLKSSTTFLDSYETSGNYGESVFETRDATSKGQMLELGLEVAGLLGLKAGGQHAPKA
jgi:chromosome partitioning protein